MTGYLNEDHSENPTRVRNLVFEDWPILQHKDD